MPPTGTGSATAPPDLMAAAAGRRADTCPDVPARAWRPSGWLIASAGAHLAAGGLLLAAPRRWPVAAAALAGNHLALAAAGLWPRSQVLGPAVVRLPAAAAARGEVGLTFDDGPDPRVTPRVAEWLARRGARASFFCVGRRAERHPELIAELVRLGHRVENHSHSHPNAFAFYGAAAQRREIRRAQAVLAATAGAPPAYFRAPAGFRNLLLERELAAAGLWLAAWTRRGFDTVSRDPRRIAGRLLRGLAAGDVLLLHDGSPAADRRGQPVVLAALDRLLDGLEAHGLRAVPLPPPLPALPELPPLIGAGEEAS